MIRGCQREMIVLQTKESPFFENAYLVLRKQRRGGANTDMMAEAMRIIGEGGGYLRAKRRRTGWISFGFGVLLGVALALFGVFVLKN